MSKVTEVPHLHTINLHHVDVDAPPLLPLALVVGGANAPYRNPSDRALLRVTHDLRRAAHRVDRVMVGMLMTHGHHVGVRVDGRIADGPVVGTGLERVGHDSRTVLRLDQE